MLKNGYEKVNVFVYKVPSLFRADGSNSQTTQGLFKTATFRRWMVLASRPELIEDVRKAPENVLSMNASAIEVRMLPGTLNSYS